MRRVLLVNCTDYRSERHGKALMMRGIVDFLAVEPEVELRTVSIGVDVGGDVTLPMPDKGEVAAAFLRALPERPALQNMLYRSAALAQQLRHLMTVFAPEVVLFDTLRTGQYVGELHLPPSVSTVLYMDDLYSKRYRRILHFERDYRVSVNAFGNFVRHIPAVWRSLLEKPPLQRLLLRYEARALSSVERRAVDCFDRVLLISEVESAELAALTGGGQVQSIKPWLPALPTQRDVDPRGRFVFLGDLSVPHNEVSTFLFLQSQLPGLRERLPGARFVVIGKGATPRLRALAAAHPEQVDLMGYVDDLGRELGRATALVAPLLFGSGVKIKLMDALAAGLPVVASSVASEGVAFDPGVPGMIVEDEMNRYVAHFAALMDPDLNRQASEGAVQQYERHYGRQAMETHYREVLTGGSS